MRCKPIMSDDSCPMSPARESVACKDDCSLEAVVEARRAKCQRYGLKNVYLAGYTEGFAAR